MTGTLYYLEKKDSAVTVGKGSVVRINDKSYKVVGVVEEADRKAYGLVLLKEM